MPSSVSDPIDWFTISGAIVGKWKTHQINGQINGTGISKGKQRNIKLFIIISLLIYSFNFLIKLYSTFDQCAVDKTLMGYTW